VEKNTSYFFQISNASYFVVCVVCSVCKYDAYCGSELNVSMHLLISLAKKKKQI